MTWRSEIVVVGGGPVGVCAAHALAAGGASVTLLEKELEVCPPASGAHANCGLLVPSDTEPLASPGALGKGLRWMRDSSSPFYIAPRPSPELLRWLWLFRAAATPARARAAAPVLRALHVASAALHDELAREHGERWLFHHDGIVQAYEESAAMAQAAEEADVARGFGVRAQVLAEGEVRKRYPGMRGMSRAPSSIPEDGHLDPMLFTREMAGLAAAAGADVRRGAEAIALEGEGGGVRVVTTRGDVHAGQVVLAAGAWTPRLTRGLGLGLPIEPAKGYSVDVERPADFPELPLYLGDAHVRPHAARRRVAAGQHAGVVRLGHDHPPQARRVAAQRRRTRDGHPLRRARAADLARTAPRDARRSARDRARAGPRVRHRRLRALHARTVAGPGDGQACRRAGRRRATVARPRAALAGPLPLTAARAAADGPGVASAGAAVPAQERRTAPGALQPPRRRHAAVFSVPSSPSSGRSGCCRTRGLPMRGPVS